MAMKAVGDAFDNAWREAIARNPHYRETKKNLEEDVQRARWTEGASVLGMLAGVVFTTIGIGSVGARHFTAGSGLIGFFVPVTLCSYNSYRASKNFMKKVQTAPEQLMVLGAANAPVPVNQIKLRKCLLKGTLGFEPVVGLYIYLRIHSAIPTQKTT